MAILSTSIIKYILCKYYTKIGNHLAYQNINNRFKKHLEKINHLITKEGYIICKGILERIDKFEDSVFERSL